MRRLQNLKSKYDVAVPPSLKPAIRAYALGYLTVTGPRLVGFLRLVAKRDVSVSQKLRVLYNILRTSTQINRFPSACGIIVGGATVVPRLVKAVLQWLLQVVQGKEARNLGPTVLTRIRFITTFLSAWVAFGLLNRDQEWSRKRAKSLSATKRHQQDSTQQPPPFLFDYPNQHHLPPAGTKTKWAGKTMDLTLFGLCRALDASVLRLWRDNLSLRRPVVDHPRVATWIAKLADPLTFTLSAAVVMRAWFYTPERLPKSYNHWIDSAAKIDPRLIEVLRRARTGEWLYGQDTGRAHLMGSMANELGLPESLGDPKVTIPVACEIVHSGTGASCEYHALSRWVRSFFFAMNLYVPIQVLTQLRAFIKTPYYIRRLHIIWSVIRSSSRSSSFLATFIFLFYYTVCLVRTRIPQLYCHAINSSSFRRHRSITSTNNHDLSPPSSSSPSLSSSTGSFDHHDTRTNTNSGVNRRSKYGYYKSISTATRQAIDGGYCVLTACFTCGLSVFTEKPGRRAEFAQFVAPRALATLLPRVYDARHLWKEQLVFAASAAVVVGGVAGTTNSVVVAATKTRNDVRGVLGRVLASVLKEQ